MEFHSPIFLFAFLPVIVLLHDLAPRRARNLVLLAVSLLLYAWREGAALGAMVSVIAVSWLAGRAIASPGPERTADKRSRRAPLALVVGVGFCLAVLAWFKYGAALARSLGPLLDDAAVLAVAAQVTLPAGVSFYVFQAISYLVDVHRGRVRGRPSLPRFALFIALFPQLVAGPILRWAPLATQLERRTITLAERAQGVRRFVRGLAKKVLIADVLAPWCDAVFALPPDGLTAGLAWGAAGLFALQIYFDFSGYTDMAIGLGLLFGFRFPENFRTPYAASSMRGFWQRWHITLTTWLRDYLVPLLEPRRREPAERRRRRRWRAARTILIVFAACGAWHGAAWHFVAWGLYHGAFLVLELAGLGRWLARRPFVLGWLYVQVVLAFNWPLFRCATIADAVAFQAAMLGVGTSTPPPGLDLHLDAVQVGAVVAGVLWSLPLVAVPPRAAAWLQRPVGQVATVAAQMLVLGLVLARLAAGTWRTFLYFRF
jgi:alginate O-acetyltransferase complex protein AlgI